MADEINLVKISDLPAATSPGNQDVLAGVQTGDTKQFSFATILGWIKAHLLPSDINAVPVTRKVNNKALAQDITLDAYDVGAYELPSTGIPKTDLAQGVQDSLDAADTAYQLPSGGIPSSDLASAVQTSLGLADTAYQKPSGGIPGSDLASGVVPAISTSTPQMDGTGAAGSTGEVSDAGHVHPIDTSRLPVYGMGENLLDNWDFTNPVNQRGQSSYTFTTATYSIDRWKLNRGTINLGATGITFVWNGNTSYAPFMQPNARYDALVGCKVTFSALTANGDLYSKTITVPSSGSSETPAGDPVRFIASASSKSLGLLITTTTGVVIVAVKAELGTEQTLAHQESGAWVLNEVPSYEKELLKCQTSTADANDTYANKSLATEQQLAYVESGTTASKNYAEAELFCWKGLLYKAKSAISSGATLDAGETGNCELTTVGMALTPIFTTWSPTNAVVWAAGRNHYVIFGNLLIITVGVKLSSPLSNGSEVIIWSNVASSIGRTILVSALTAVPAIAAQTGMPMRIIRVQYNNGNLIVRNDSGGTIDTNHGISCQMILPIL